VIDQTIPLDKLTAGMANCVREWILPHLTDPMARIQAEQLIGILAWLPSALEPHALKLIQSDSQEARALLRAAGEPTPPIPANAFLGDLLAENAALKESLEALADRLRVALDPASAERLLLIQRYFVRSLRRESAGASVQQFAEMSVRDQEGKQDLAAGD
jgi:hypothetical protein